MGKYVTVFPVDLATIISGLALVTAIAAIAVSLYVHFDSSKPVVVAYLECDERSGSVRLVVRNLGRSVARDVRVEGFDFDVMCEGKFRGHARKSFISRGVPCLVPGACRRTVIATTRYVQSSVADSDCRVTVRYAMEPLSRRRCEVCEEFVLDFYSFANTIHVNGATGASDES